MNEAHKDEHKKIGKHAGTFGFFTLVSRILGLARDASLAFALGATPAADAFYVAFRLPNLLRRFVAEGSLTVAFVPVFTSYLKRSDEEGRNVFSIVFSFLFIFLIGIVILGIAFAPFLIRLIAYGFTTDPYKFHLAVGLARVMFPYIMLISLMALSMGVLNSRHIFGPSAAAPIFLNISMIVAALVAAKWFATPVWIVAASVIIGGMFQLLLQFPYLKRENMFPSFKLEPRHPGIKELLMLMLPAAYGAAVYQINVLVITLLASFLPSGSITYLWFADRLAEFPLGIFAIAVATAALPSLSRFIADGDEEGYKQTLAFGLKFTWVITIPAAVGLYALAGPIVEILFMRGKFTPEAAMATTGALRMFALGIPFVGAVRNLVPAFYAKRDSKTPVIVATICLAINAGVALILMHSLKHVGLAFAIAASSFSNFIILLSIVRKREGELPKLLEPTVRTLIAAIPMFLFIHGCHYLFPSDGRTLYKLIWLIGVLIVSVIVYTVSLIPIYREGFGYLKSVVKR